MQKLSKKSEQTTTNTPIRIPFNYFFMMIAEQHLWRNIVQLFKMPEYKKVHKWYSSKDGWAYLSYKHTRVFVNYEYTYKHIKEILEALSFE